jgi:hypothetical protein
MKMWMILPMLFAGQIAQAGDNVCIDMLNSSFRWNGIMTSLAEKKADPLKYWLGNYNSNCTNGDDADQIKAYFMKSFTSSYTPSNASERDVKAMITLLEMPLPKDEYLLQSKSVKYILQLVPYISANKNAAMAYSKSTLPNLIATSLDGYRYYNERNINFAQGFTDLDKLNNLVGKDFAHQQAVKMLEASLPKTDRVIQFNFIAVLSQVFADSLGTAPNWSDPLTPQIIEISRAIQTNNGVAETYVHLNGAIGQLPDESGRILSLRKWDLSDRAIEDLNTRLNAGDRKSLQGLIDNMAVALAYGASGRLTTPEEIRIRMMASNADKDALLDKLLGVIGSRTKSLDALNSLLDLGVITRSDVLKRSDKVAALLPAPRRSYSYSRYDSDDYDSGSLDRMQIISNLLNKLIEGEPSAQVLDMIVKTQSIELFKKALNNYLSQTNNVDLQAEMMSSAFKLDSDKWESYAITGITVLSQIDQAPTLLKNPTIRASVIKNAVAAVKMKNFGYFRVDSTLITIVNLFNKSGGPVAATEFLGQLHSQLVASDVAKLPSYGFFLSMTSKWIEANAGREGTKQVARQILDERLTLPIAISTHRDFITRIIDAGYNAQDPKEESELLNVLFGRFKKMTASLPDSIKLMSDDQLVNYANFLDLNDLNLSVISAAAKNSSNLKAKVNFLRNILFKSVNQYVDAYALSRTVLIQRDASYYMLAKLLAASGSQLDQKTYADSVRELRNVISSYIATGDLDVEPTRYSVRLESTLSFVRDICISGKDGISSLIVNECRNSVDKRLSAILDLQGLHPGLRNLIARVHGEFENGIEKVPDTLEE